MKVQTFIAKGTGMTAVDIAEMFNDVCEQWDVESNITSDDVKMFGQMFVNKEASLREEYIDYSEEDFVDARSDLIMDIMTKNLKRGDLVKAITESRGW